jgi:hypothetical protein
MVVPPREIPDEKSIPEYQLSMKQVLCVGFPEYVRRIRSRRLI